MENNKKGNGLVIFLIILVLVMAVGLTLLLSGVINSPFVNKDSKEVETTETTVKEDKKESDNEVKETRYYQMCENIEWKDGPDERCYELELDADGTAKLYAYHELDWFDKEGIYTEDDKYIIVALNIDNLECVEGNYTPQIVDACSSTRIFIKDKDTIKEEHGSIYHFSIDNETTVREYKQVQKSDLKTNLKN